MNTESDIALRRDSIVTIHDQLVAHFCRSHQQRGADARDSVALRESAGQRLEDQPHDREASLRDSGTCWPGIQAPWQGDLRGACRFARDGSDRLHRAVAHRRHFLRAVLASLRCPGTAQVGRLEYARVFRREQPGTTARFRGNADGPRRPGDPPHTRCPREPSQQSECHPCPRGLGCSLSSW